MEHKKLVNEKSQPSSQYFLDPNPNGSPVVLLLHGLGADGSSWERQMMEFTLAGIRPLAPDISGFGKSEFHNGKWSVQKAAAEVIQLLDDLGIPISNIVGLSMGGTLALWLVLHYPDRVRRLVLVNTFACLRPKNLSQYGYYLKRLAITMVKGGFDQAEIVAWRVFPREDQEQLRNLLIKNIVNTDPRVYRQAMMSLGTFDVRRNLKEIKCPTMIVSGQDDTTVAMQSQLELVHGISGARHVIIPHAGHAVSIDQAAIFNEKIINFISFETDSRN